MPTVETPQDKSITATMALEVQWQQEVPAQVGETPGIIVVEPVGNPVWVLPTEIAPFKVMANRLMEYKVAVASDALEGAVVLSEPTLARWHGDVMDPKCPCLTVIFYLKNRGWRPVDRAVIHDSTDIGEMDGAEAIKFRSYFQCLVVVDRVMPLTSRLPSREPVPYYRLLLSGTAAEPGWPAKDLQLILNGVLRKRGKKTELLPIEGREAESLDPDGIICPGPELPAEPAPPKKSGGPKRQRLDDPVAQERDPVPLAPSGGGGGGPPGAHGEPPGVVPDPLPVPAPIGDDPDGFMPGPELPAEPPAKKQKIEGVFSDGLDGAKIMYKLYPDPHNVEKTYPNYTLQCPRPGCKGCTKVKGETPGNTKRHGVLEPIAYLHAWIPCRDAKGVKTHRNCDPTPEEVDAYVARNRDRLQELYERLRG